MFQGLQNQRLDLAFLLLQEHTQSSLQLQLQLHIFLLEVPALMRKIKRKNRNCVADDVDTGPTQKICQYTNQLLKTLEQSIVDSKFHEFEMILS